MTQSSLIINSPFEMPQRYWGQDDNGKIQRIQEGRRPAAYELFDTRNNTRRVEPLEQVNRIRERVDAWRDAGWPGVTSVTRELLEHWHARGEWNPDEHRWEGGPRQNPFYFCQLEAIETLIWWVEGQETFKQGIYLQGDGGAWERVCNKMATGSGKTSVMALIITWQTLNALSYPKDSRFSSAIFVVAPGLTVKSRLQVLYPGNEKNVYDEFRICPNEALRQKLNRVELLVENWHSLMPLKEQDRSVVKKGKESDEAFTRRVLGKLAGYKDLVIINDEAHHAYRQKAEIKVSKKEAEELGIDLDEATRWIEGLDRIHKTRRIRRCFDLSATPFAPTGKSNTEAGLFEWVISDFGLNDAIEAGLVKTPRVVVRDDALANAKSYRSKLYHLYREDEVREDLNQKAEPHQSLPDLVQKAYAILAYDWQQTAQAWEASGHSIPPVLLTVCNRTETAARVEHFFNSGDCLIQGTKALDRTLRVDSKVLESAERGENASSGSIFDQKFNIVVRLAGLSADKLEELKGVKKKDKLAKLIEVSVLDQAIANEISQLKGEEALSSLANYYSADAPALSYIKNAVDYGKRLEEIIRNSGVSLDAVDSFLEKKLEEQLRDLVDTVGKRGKPGQKVQNVISVAMLSEGWDAANVTHIMGLRAFTSQLLCEQVIGRGLRRVAHDMDANGLFLPEYVNVFGVPLSIFQEVDDGGSPPPPPKPSVRIEVEPGRNQFEIKWPNIQRIETVLKTELVMDWAAVPALMLDPMQTPLSAEIAPSLTGAPNLGMISQIDLEKAVEDFRLQQLIFRATRKLYLQSADSFGGDKQYLAVQLIRLVEQFLASDKLDISSLWHQDEVRKRLLFALNMDTVVGHVSRHVQEQNVEKLAAIFDEAQPIGSTAQMRPWLTTKPCEPVLRSQISHAVYDSVWEKAVVDICEKESFVAAWAKNDHLDFVIRYLWRGSSRKFIPDYLIRLNNGKTLILEVKGQDSEQNRAKRAATDVWIKAVNEQGGFGQWCFDVVFDPSKIRDVIIKSASDY